MKKTFFVILLGIFTQLSVFSQNKSLEKIFDHYSAKEEYTVVSIGESMISSVDMFALNDNLKDMTSGIKSLKIIASTDDSDVDKNTLQKREALNKALDGDVKKVMNKENFEILLQARDGGDNIEIYKKPFKNKESDFVLLVKSDDSEYVVIWIYGEIDSKKITKTFSE